MSMTQSVGYVINDMLNVCMGGEIDSSSTMLVSDGWLVAVAAITVRWNLDLGKG